MKCRDVQDLLSPYIDQVLDAGEMSEIEEHLAHCSSCSDEYHSLSAVVFSIRDLGEVDPPDGFHSRLMDRLQKQQKKKVYFPSWLPVGAAAAVLLILFVGLGLGNDLWKGVQGVDLMTEESTDSAAQEQPRGLGGGPPPDQSGAEQGSFGGSPASEVKMADRSSDGQDQEIAENNAGADEDAGNEQMEGASAGAPRMQQYEADAAPYAAAEDARPSNGEQRKIVKSGMLRIEVSDYEGTVNAITGKVESMQGYVEATSTNTQDYGTGTCKVGYLVLRVPADNFAVLMEAVSEMGDVLDKSINGRDVTTEYFDAEARLKVMQEKEHRLTELLSEADKIEDILKIEKELDAARTEIEQLQGHIKLLSQNVAFSTLNVTVEEKKTPDDKVSGISKGRFWDRVSGAFIGSVNGLLRTGSQGLILFSSLLPYIFSLIILAAAGVFLKKLCFRSRIH